MIHSEFYKKNLARVFVLCLLTSTALATTGCTALAVGSAVVATTTIARQDKGIAQSIDDVKLTIKASNVLYENGLSGYVKVRVNEGHAILIGVVKDSASKKLAERLVSSIPGIVDVANDLRVDPKNHQKLSGELADLAITSSIKSRFALNPGVRYGNYTVVTMDKTVYIIGVYHDKPELDRVLSIARNVDGVKQVVSYLEPAK